MKVLSLLVDPHRITTSNYPGLLRHPSFLCLRLNHLLHLLLSFLFSFLGLFPSLLVVLHYATCQMSQSSVDSFGVLLRSVDGGRLDGVSDLVGRAEGGYC